MRHTFLFEPALWNATGTFRRADGEVLQAVSHLEIAHRPECWLLSGKLKVLATPPAEFVHAYLIEPPGSEDASMKWTFENAMFGTLKGRFTVIGRSILSVYGCQSTGFHGCEHLGQRDPNHYRSTGMLLQGDKVAYSWEMLYERA